MDVRMIETQQTSNDKNTYNSSFIVACKSLFLIIVPFGLVIIPMYFVRQNTDSYITAVVLLLAGVISGLSVITFITYITSMRLRKHTEEKYELFDEGAIKQHLTAGWLQIIKKGSFNDAIAYSSTSYPWSLGLDKLTGIDNVLAFAKLRLEIEQELRRIAYENNIDIGTRPLGAKRMAQELIQKEILPDVWDEAVKKIVGICDRVVHGANISNSTAAVAIDIGGQLLEKLRLLKVKDPSGQLPRDIKKENKLYTSDPISDVQAIGKGKTKSKHMKSVREHIQKSVQTLEKETGQLLKKENK